MFRKKPDGASLSDLLPADWHLDELGLLGTGGQSEVHRVRDQTLGREIALKVLRAELEKDPHAVDFFVQEAQITAQLDHPNIPPVYALAAGKPSHCFTMKVLQGSNLEQILFDAAPLSADARFAALEVMVRVCDAVAFAHSRGILHCDLKPENIMVGEHGQIYVVDWGYARRKGAPLVLWSKDIALGTPAYMAPEQAQGLNDAIDERTDIFQLGCILYRILAGKPPFWAETGEATLRLAIQCEIPPPEQIGRGNTVPRRLSAICMRAMAKSPAARYATASDLKRELEDFIRGTARLPEKLFRSGEVVVREGEHGDCAYIILDGHCQASKRVGGVSTGLRLMGPGEMFGETAVLAGSPRLATVTALMDTTVAVVDRTFLQEEMERSSLIALAIRALAERFLDLDGRTTALTEEQNRSKVIELALEELALSGQPLADGAGVQVPWTKLSSKIARQTHLPNEAIVDRLSRHPSLRLDLTRDSLVLLPSRTG